MKVTITAPPKLLTSLFINPEKIAEDENASEYSRHMKEFIFGKETIKCAELMGLDIFNLIFIKNTPFRETVLKKVRKIPDRKKENVMTALLINALYKGKHLRLFPLYKSNDNIYIGEAVVLRLSIIDMSADFKRKNSRLLRLADKYEKISPEYNLISQKYIDTIHMAAVKYRMRSAINEKEFMDKINYRRFSSELRLNNRPAEIAEINSMLMRRKNMTFIDLTDTSSRLYLSALYTMTFRNLEIKEIYDSKLVFSDDYNESIYSLSASEFINIIYNGNGIEISDIMVKMAEKFAKIKLPRIDGDSLIDIIDNFKEIYAVAAIAYKFDKAFSEHEMLKKNMRKQMIDSYWAVYSNILQFKKFGTVVAFCYLLSNIDLDKYRDDISYSDRISDEFSAVGRTLKEIKKETDGM